MSIRSQAPPNPSLNRTPTRRCATTEYLFKFHSMFRSSRTETFENGYIAYSADRLAELDDIDGLITELSKVSRRLKVPHP